MKTTLEREVGYPPQDEAAPQTIAHRGRTYYVYASDSTVVIRRPRRRRMHETLERRYEVSEVRALAAYYAGKTVTAEQAAADVRAGLVQLRSISWRLHARMDLRVMFVALCALGHARLLHGRAGAPAFAVH